MLLGGKISTKIVFVLSKSWNQIGKFVCVCLLNFNFLEIYEDVPAIFRNHSQMLKKNFHKTAVKTSKNFCSISGEHFSTCSNL